MLRRRIGVCLKQRLLALDTDAERVMLQRVHARLDQKHLHFVSRAQALHRHRQAFGQLQLCGNQCTRREPCTARRVQKLQDANPLDGLLEKGLVRLVGISSAKVVVQAKHNVTKHTRYLLQPLGHARLLLDLEVLLLNETRLAPNGLPLHLELQHRLPPFAQVLFRAARHLPRKEREPSEEHDHQRVAAKCIRIRDEREA
mmetsp:Transcript_99711/g.304828  ORF Transcript_99711/g.304828 Transcript_99711/m.304828 type:complete len:200 (+) Transcript_99711:224-823(+)